MGIHFIRMHLIGVPLVGYLLLACLSWRTSHRSCISWRASHGRLTHVSHGCEYLTGMFLMGLYLISVHLHGRISHGRVPHWHVSVYIMGVHLEGVNLVSMYHHNFS